MRVIDLSGPIESGMWSYGPPLPSISIDQIAAIDPDGWSGHKLKLNTLTGTYIETAKHVLTRQSNASRTGA